MDLFNNHAVGIDIDDRSIELVELKKLGGRAKLVNFSRQALPQGIVVNGLIKEPELLTHFWAEALAKAKPNVFSPKRIALALPESQSYNLVVSTPFYNEAISEEEVRQLIIKNLPVNIDDLIFSYQLIQTEPKQALVSLTAANKAAVSQWLDFFSDLDLSLEFIDNEIFALSRDLVYLDPKQPVCLVDIGSVQTNIAVLQAAAVYYANSLALGGHYFTKAIAQNFKLKLVTAERKKLQLGLNSQIFPVLAKQLKTISAEIKAAVNYYQEHYGGAVKEVVLVGGSSRLKGLVNFLQENIGLPVSLGRIKSLAEKLPLEYYGAIGLAWRSLNKKRFAEEPDFLALLGNHKSMVKKTVPIIKIAEPAQAAKSVAAVKTAPADEPESLEAVPAAVSDDLADDGGEAKAIARQKKWLLVILLLGLVALPLAFWYRQQERASQAANINRYAGSALNQVQDLTFILPVVLDNPQAGPGEVKGRIVESTISAGQTYSAGLPAALSQARDKAVKGETFWPQPLNEVVSQDKLTAPLTLRWLVYDQAGALKAALAKVDALNQAKADYSFNNLEVVAVTKTDQINSVEMTVKITIAVSQPLAEAASQGLTVVNPAAATSTLPAATSTPALAVKQVLIKSTETGWLNIRTGPGANFPIVQKVNPGESYEWLGQQGDWIKIKLPGDKEGWGAARYIQLK
jgi:type IV pilus assembly protein PilM